MATKKYVEKLVQAVEGAAAQGERAMLQLGWTHQNLKWRDQLEELKNLALASAVSEQPLFGGLDPDYADSAE